MTQTFALLLDSYRELNAKRLFWVVLAVSGLVVALFASIGLSAGSVTLLGWTTPIHSPLLSFVTREVFYKQMFVTFGIEYWLAWLASILALISTAGIFPDLMAGGSIDLYLSKPISRLRLFATKVFGGLLFVTLQVTVFCACCFVVLRVRGGDWEPGVFIAIPLVVLMFSYLFAACVLLGVVTRSTIAALLLTLLFWAVIWAVQRSEALLQLGQSMNQQRAANLDRRIAATEAELATVRDRPATTTPTTGRSEGGSWFGDLFGGGSPHSRRALESDLADLREQRQRVAPNGFATAHTVLAAALAPLPKTVGTIEVLERQLIKLTDLPPVANPAESDAAVLGPPDAPPDRPGLGGRGRRRGGGAFEERQLDIQLRQQSAAWLLGSSAAFEAVVLSLAAWLFCRRDY